MDPFEITSNDYDYDYDYDYEYEYEYDSDQSVKWLCQCSSRL
jgi:hypothetical protein